LDALSRAGRVVLVDGLTGLTLGDVPAAGVRREKVLRSRNVVDIKKDIEAAVGELGTRRKVLVVDQLDALLAITDEATTSLVVQNLLLSLRDVSFSLCLHGI
jgi:elongator complex protein 6